MQAARAGTLEQHISNVWRIVGTAVGAAGMVMVAMWAPTMAGFAMALAAPAVVGGIGDSVGYVVRHPELTPRVKSFRRILIAPLLSTGSGFLAFSAGGFLISGLSLVVASSVIPANALATVGILLQLQALGLGVVNMVAIPLWPSVAHAEAASDREWIVQAYHGLRRIAVGAGMIGAVGIVVVLPPIAARVFGKGVAFDIGLTLPFAALFIAACWGTLHAFVLFGLGSARWVGVLTVIQGIIGLVILFITIDPLGPSAVGTSALLSALAVTAWLLPWRVHRRLQALGP
jgi:O-antigen/teichoic acid export membrane protein